MDEAAKEGDEVTIQFTGKLKDGTPVLSTIETGPFSFQVGDDTIFEKLGQAVAGMSPGEKKVVQLNAEDAFGERDDNLLMEVPLEKIKSEIEVGNVLVDPVEEDIQWEVMEIRETTVLLDGNHPLAGKALDFEIELVSIDGEGDGSTGPTVHQKTNRKIQ